MDNHFLRFRVQNFKCFDDLTLDNLGLINIIVGDNNVGKTSLLEALLFTPEYKGKKIEQRWIGILHNIRKLKGLKDYPIKYYLPRRNPNNTITNMVFSFTEIGDKNYECSIPITEPFDNVKLEMTRQNLQKLSSKELAKITKVHQVGELDNTFRKNMPYAYFHLGYDADLVEKYAKIQFDDAKQELLLNTLKALIPKIRYVEPSAIIENDLAIIVRQEGLPTLPLASFGEGAIKLFRLLMEIIEWSHQRLMIDEIETGMHHSRMIPFWQAILNTAYSQDTQLFATTHSLECLQKLREVLEKPENEHLRDKVRIIKLAQTLKKGIQAYIYPYENFEYSLENDIEIR